MITFNLLGTRLCFDFSFFAIVALIGATDKPDCLYYSLVACILHEAGHLVVMRLSGIRAKMIVLYYAGIKIIKERSFIPFKNEFFILCGGCAANFISFFVLYHLDNIGVKQFAVINLIVGIFNLLPAETLDGGQLMLNITRKSEIIHKAALIVSKLTMPVVFTAAVIFMIKADMFNPSLIITSLFFGISSLFYDISADVTKKHFA